MMVIVTKNLRHLVSFRKMVKNIGNWKQEMHRGVIATGKKSKTQVQRAVSKQMAIAPGYYQSYVVRNINGRGSRKG